MQRLPPRTVSHPRRRVGALLVGAAVLALAGVPARVRAQSAMPEAERQRVERLLRAVEAQPELRFERNGRRAGPVDAVRFLRAKWAQRGSGVRSAEAFIDQIASQSSTSGLPYRVCQPDGGCTEAGPWLHALLARADRAAPTR